MIVSPRTSSPLARSEPIREVGQVAERRLQDPGRARAEPLAERLGGEGDDVGDAGEGDAGDDERRDRRGARVVHDSGDGADRGDRGDRQGLAAAHEDAAYGSVSTQSGSHP